MEFIFYEILIKIAGINTSKKGLITAGDRLPRQFINDERFLDRGGRYVTGDKPENCGSVGKAVVGGKS